MNIKELDISGFKSFAGKTLINFDQKITSVVGPNGCGKSNILDAVKWVLGEKSVKSMRGEKMEDLIFSGTEHKKAAGFAQVAITFDNSDRTFSIEDDNVKIGRRVYRDGASQYLINDKKVTRKEIESLLMDTGLGKSSYSFMEQGNMDQILSSKPEDRREIFEEAAGISKYKARKEEAQKNLQNTEVNLTRIRDIIRELERQLKQKEEQAQRTEKYNTLKATQKDHDLKIRYITISSMEKELDKLQHSLSRKKETKEKCNQKTFLLEEKLENLDKDRETLLEQLHQKDIANKVSIEKISQFTNSIETLNTRKKNILSEADSLKEQINDVDIRIKEIKTQISNQSQLNLELQNQIEVALQSQVEIENDLKNNEIHFQTSRQNIEDCKNKVKINISNISKKRDALSNVVEDILSELNITKEKWSNVEEENQTILEHTFASYKELEQHIEKLYQYSQENDSTNLKNTLISIKEFFNPEQWKSNIAKLSLSGSSLLQKLFDEGSFHSQKEKLDQEIKNLESEIHTKGKEIVDYETKLQYLGEEKTSFIKKSEAVRGDIRSFKLQKSNLAEREQSLKAQLNHTTKQLHYFQEKYNFIETDILILEKEKKQLEINIDEEKKGIQKELDKIEALKSRTDKLEKNKSTHLELIRKEKIKSEEAIEEINECEIKVGTYLASQEAMVQEIYNDYNLTLNEVKEQFNDAISQLRSEESKLTDIRKQIENLGPINPLAIEELNAIKNIHEHHTSQLKDIEDARNKITSVIDEIEKKSEAIFKTTFEQITKNFLTAFQKLFKGGRVELSLTTPEKVLTSGIDIMAQPPGKRARSLRLLSGGEKALTAIALMFGIYMVRSSPFCIMDEIDAPLDDANVLRFLDLLEEFSQETQFILITHNKKTMAKAHSIFGVTMEEPGVSRLFSVKLKASNS